MHKRKKKLWVIGLFTLLIVVGTIFMYDFLKGRDLFNKEHYYYVVFDQVGGLYKSNHVLINGLGVGKVSRISFVNDTSSQLLVELQLPSKRKIPVNATASIIHSGLMGGRSIQLNNATGPGPYLKDGDTIRNSSSQDSSTVAPDALQSFMVNVSTLAGNLNHLTLLLNETLNSEFQQDLWGMADQLHTTSIHLNKTMQMLPSTVAQTRGTLAQVGTASERATEAIATFNALADTLQQANLRATIRRLDSTIAQIQYATQLATTGHGSMGQLISSDSLYRDLRSTISHLDSLIVDVKANPKRYINVSLF